jgi:hypothetical protein
LDESWFYKPEIKLTQKVLYRSMQAFICNYRDHWFTIRRLGRQWFNLNSLLTGPELISDTYLAMFLAQLQQEGNSYQQFFSFLDLDKYVLVSQCI